MSVARALEVLLSSTHLSITVKSNLLAFKEIIACNDRPVDVSPFTSNLINNTTSIPIQQQQHGRGGAGKLHQKAGNQVGLCIYFFFFDRCILIYLFHSTLIDASHFEQQSVLS
ncbi:unnamed protein product [Anisakis simplex]|uniref:Uncharacterized protein n=1 Tax=Anisakis simplex TaxID=6269 RepID=A0A0M3JKD2_ANISI|nr:unnamed protein product [Anisakis simplex]